MRRVRRKFDILITRNSLAKALRFSDIKDLALLPEHEINARLVRKTLRELFEK
jgi:hypothetical protein